MSDIGSRSNTKRTHRKSSRSTAPIIEKVRSAKPSQSFWDQIEAREVDLCNERILIICRKCIARVVKSEQLVIELNNAILKARDINDLSSVASLRIEEKAAEKNWKYFVSELHKYLDGPNLPEGPLRDGEIEASQPLFDRFDAFFDTNKPRPPSPPNGPIEYYDGEYSGNVYKGSFLPWKRERHGDGTMYYGDGTRIAGTFVRDQLHGPATIYFNDRVRVFVGGWRKGQRNGHGILETKHGVQYISWEGQWKKGLPNGLGTYTTRCGHKVFGEWNKPKLMHGGRTIRFNHVKLSLPGKPPGSDLFEGKAELENAANMRLRVLHIEHNKLYKEYGSVEYDKRLTKKVEAQERALKNEIKVVVNWRCHVCFYQNGESDSEESDSDEGSEEENSDESDEDDGGNYENHNNDTQDIEDDEDDEDSDDDEDDENDEEDDDDMESMDLSLFWSTGEINSVWECRTTSSAEQHMKNTHQLKHQLTLREEAYRQASLELIGWMMEAGISQEKCEKYVADMRLEESDRDPMDLVTEIAAMWRETSIRELVDQHNIKQLDAEMLVRAPPFTVDLGDFGIEDVDDDDDDQPKIKLPLLLNSSSSSSSSFSMAPETLQLGGGNKLQLFTPITHSDHSITKRLQTGVLSGDNDTAGIDDNDDGKEPSVDPQVIYDNIETLIEGYKSSKPKPIKASQHFRLPKRMSMRSKSISLRRNGSFTSFSPPTSPKKSPKTMLTSRTENSEMVVQKCRSCGCPDTAQLRLGPLGRLRAAKMIDPGTYPRNVRHIRARREMAKDIWLGQPYDPNAFKTAHP